MASPFVSGLGENYLLAGIFESRGQWNDALKIYQSFSDASVFDRVFRVPGLIGSARIHEKTGDLPAALDAVRQVESLWSSADAEFQPLLDEAAELKRRLEAALL